MICDCFITPAYGLIYEKWGKGKSQSLLYVERFTTLRRLRFKIKLRTKLGAEVCLKANLNLIDTISGDSLVFSFFLLYLLGTSVRMSSRMFPLWAKFLALLKVKFI